MSQELSGKVAIITGGTNGIGRGTAEVFLEEGAKVVIGDVDPEGASVAAELGPNCRFKHTDVGKADDIQALVDFAVAEFGRLDIMCNNAAVPSKMLRLLEDPLDDFERHMNVNLLGVMRGTQIAARQMIKNGGGSIINTASIAGMQASFGIANYRSAKAAVIHFSKCAAIELAEYEIRVNCLVPGQIPTNIIKDSFVTTVDPDKLDKLDARMREVMHSYQPIRRKGETRDAANASVFLGSDRSTYITGVILPVDGGITAGLATNYVEKFDRIREEIMGDEAA